MIDWLPSEIQIKIKYILPPHQELGADMNLCPGDVFGNFTVASTYSLLCDHASMDRNDNWKRIWRLGVPERVKSFLWLVLHGSLITKERKNKIHLRTPYCIHCREQIETKQHVLIDCSQALATWLNVVPTSMRRFFYFFL